MLYKTFWTAIFTSFLFVFLGVNIAFTFDLVNFVNPTALVLYEPDYYHNYWFGFQSFKDAFVSYFGDGGALRGYSNFLTKFGAKIGEFYTSLQTVLNLPNALTKQNPAWELISAMFAILIIANSVLPMLVIVFYLILYFLYIVCFAFMLLSFIVAFFGGGFKTPLPNTYDFDSPLLSNTVYSIRSVIMV